MRYAVALFLAAVAILFVAAFIDSCDTTATAHDRAIIGTTIAVGGLVLALLWGRFSGRAWIPLVTAGVFAGGTLALMESLQFGACLS